MPPAEPASKKDAADRDTDNDIIMQRSSRMQIHARGRLNSSNKVGNKVHSKANPRRMQTRRATRARKEVEEKAASREKERVLKEMEANSTQLKPPPKQLGKPSGARMD